MAERGKQSLLIVDDDPQLRYLIEAAARRTGCFSRVESTINGGEVFALLGARQPAEYPDLILSDLSMPRMNGLELIRQLKRHPDYAGIPVAIITSSNVPNDREDALAAGACAFLEKPQGLEALTRLLTTLREGCGQPTM